MKKVLLSLLLIGSAYVLNAQMVVFSEDFEGVVKLTSSGAPGWASHTSHFKSPTKSFRSIVGNPPDTSVLTSQAFSTTNNYFVTLSFWHICKVEFFDHSIIEVSNDSGATWVRLTQNEYLGTAPLGIQGDKFSAASYALWVPGTNNAIPDNATWWQQEIFDVSALIFDVDNAMVRFRTYDGNGNGQNQNYGWILDDISVFAAFCETIPPSITLLPPINMGTVFNLGPYNIKADLVDASSVGFGVVNYSINNGPIQNSFMNNTIGNEWVGIIPGINAGDSVCYNVEAWDFCNNVSVLPTTGCYTFKASAGIVFPYIDNFDVANNLWTPGPATGNPQSIWELGTPAFGTTNTAYSPPNSWDINLTSAAGHNAITVLSSPVFDFSQSILPKITFWHNRNTQINNDGVTFEYTVDGVNWFVLGTSGDPNGVNWFNVANIPVSGGRPVWTGNSAGWVKSEYTITQAILNQQAGPVQFRFVFYSNATTNSDGYSFDNFSITLPSPLNVAIQGLTAPTAGTQYAAGATITPSFSVKNLGTQTLTSFPVSYVVNGAITQFMWTPNPPLAPGAVQVVTGLPSFVAPVGTFTFCAYTELSGDTDNSNDTICLSPSPYGVVVVQLGYADDFDGPLNIWNTTVIGTGNPTCVWQLGTPAYQATTGAFTAPTCWDINLNSAYTNNGNAALVSPVFNFTGHLNVKLSFMQNRKTEPGFDGFRIQYTLNGGITWTTLGAVGSVDSKNWYTIANLTAGGPAWEGNSNGWIKSEILLPTALNNQPTVQFRYVFTSDGTTQLDGVSIDDFQLELPSPIDLSVIAFTQPGPQAPAGSSGNVTVTVKNYGGTTVTAFNVVYTLNGINPISTPWAGSLTPGATAAVALGSYILPSGVHTLCAYTSIAGDGNPANDTLCINSVGIPTVSISYADSFDTGNIGWAPVATNPTTMFELGAPAYGQTTGAFSAPDAWDINLNSAYGPLATCTLFTANFDFSGKVGTTLSFWQNRRTEGSADGMRLQYSINSGAWTTLGAVGSPGSINWYTTANLTSSAGPAWEGNSGGWVRSFFPLPIVFNNSGLVQFRFIFTTDASVEFDGISIDNFRLDVPLALTAAAQNITVPNPLLLPGPQNARAVVRNVGTSSLTSVSFTLEANGNVIVTDPIFFAPALPMGSTYMHTFSLPWTAGSGANVLRAWTSNPNLLTDMDMTDDTTSRVITAFDSLNVNTNAYCNDFEGGQSEWVTLNALTYSGINNRWQLGLPNQTIINGARSGSNAWMTGLSSNYGGRDSSGLFTPLFNVNDQMCYKLSFYHMYSTELYQDGGTVEYSIDNGIIWTTLGQFGDPNWFDSQFITALGGIPSRPGWSGSSPLWLPAEHLITFPAPATVFFRFRFASDVTVHGEGWAIDDFCFERLPDSVCFPIVVSVPEATADMINLDQNYPNPTSSTTTISYSTPSRGHVELKITNLLGQQILVPVSEIQSSGKHDITFDVSNWEAGIYYYSLKFNDQLMVKKMVITH